MKFLPSRGLVCKTQVNTVYKLVLTQQKVLKYNNVSNHNNNNNNNNNNQVTILALTRSPSLFLKATAQVIKPQCDPRAAAEFLWRHLQRDLDVLGRALGRSVDDAALTVHLVLHRMISINGGETGTTFFSAGCSFPVL